MLCKNLVLGLGAFVVALLQLAEYSKVYGLTWTTFWAVALATRTPSIFHYLSLHL